MGHPLPPSIQAGLERLQRCARRELPDALAQLRARFADESVYVLALETSARCDSLGLLASSEQDLARRDQSGRWIPREWSLRLTSLGALGETNDSLDVLQGLARREDFPPLRAELRALFLALLADLSESGYCRAFGEPLLALVDLDAPPDAWHESARALNPPYLLAALEEDDFEEDGYDEGQSLEDE